MAIVFLVQIASKGSSVSCNNTPQVRHRNGRRSPSSSNNNHRGLHHGGHQKQSQNTHHHDSSTGALLLSPTRSEDEHQYDIPFSHLSRSSGEGGIGRKDLDDPEYDEMIINRRSNDDKHGSHFTASASSKKSSWKNSNSRMSGNGGMAAREGAHHSTEMRMVDGIGMLWGGNTLLQPRLISGETGGTPLLTKHDNGNEDHRRGWSGSDRSIDTSVYSGSFECWEK